jgi:hypothetical protein
MAFGKTNQTINLKFNVMKRKNSLTIIAMSFFVVLTFCLSDQETEISDISETTVKVSKPRHLEDPINKCYFQCVMEDPEPCTYKLKANDAC